MDRLGQLRRAEAILWEHWQTRKRLAALPEDMRPHTREEGYAIQAFFERRSARPVYGWKIAATSPGGQQLLNVDAPIAGRILAERALPTGAHVPLAGNQMKVLEGEFAFRLLRDLAPREVPYSRQDVRALISELHPVIEVPDSRFNPVQKAGAAQLIADNACADYFIVGDPAPESWRTLDLITYPPLKARIEGGEQYFGSGANVLGDPLVALTWLANELSGLGITLRAGELVATGTCFQPFSVKEGDRVVVDFGPVGSVEVRF